MTFEQLRYFHAAATLQHISRAAEQERISQSSMSISIKKLEEELGVLLFQPKGRGIVLTPAGEEFWDYARELLGKAEAARACMAEWGNRVNREIRVAYTASVAGGYIPKRFRRFLADTKEEYLIYSDEMPSSQIAAGLRENRFDFGICSELPQEDLVQIPVYTQPLVLIVPFGHPWAEREPEELQALSDVPYISYRSDYPMYRQIETLLESGGVKPKICHFAYSEDAIARLVEQDMGVSIIARIDQLDRFRVSVLRPRWLTSCRTLYLTYHKAHYQGRGARRMMQFFCNSAERQEESYANYLCTGRGQGGGDPDSPDLYHNKGVLL